MTSFDLKFDLCNFAPKVRYPSKFSRHIFSLYFLHFVARNARTPNFFCVNILKDKPSQRKKHSATCEQKDVFLSTGFSVKEIPKKNGKIRMLGGKMVIEKLRFYTQEMRGETESPE